MWFQAQKHKEYLAYLPEWADVTLRCFRGRTVQLQVWRRLQRCNIHVAAAKCVRELRLPLTLDW